MPLWCRCPSYVFLSCLATLVLPLLLHPRFGSNALRVQRQGEIDDAIRAWAVRQPSAEAACAALDAAEIPNGGRPPLLIYNPWPATTPGALTHPTLLCLLTILYAAGLINSVADIAADRHVRARGMIERVAIGEGGDARTLEVPAAHPHLSKSPPVTNWAGRRRPGCDTAAVLSRVLRMGLAEVQQLAAAGAVYDPSLPLPGHA